MVLVIDSFGKGATRSAGQHMKNRDRIPLALFTLRISIFVVMLMWTLDKLIAPAHAAREGLLPPLWQLPPRPALRTPLLPSPQPRLAHRRPGKRWNLRVGPAQSPPPL